MIVLDAAPAALPSNAPWWGALIVVAIPGLVAVVLEIIRLRRGGKDATAKALAALREELAKVNARLAEIEDDGTDPDVRAERHRRIEDRLTAIEKRVAKTERRTEEAAKVDQEIQRALGRVEGAMRPHDRER